MPARAPDAVSEDDDDLFTAVGVGVDGYLLKTMNFSRLSEALHGVCSSEAAMPRVLVARILDRLRHREPRWRRSASLGMAQRLTSREWEVLEMLAQGRSPADIAEEPCSRPARCASTWPRSCASSGVADRHAAIELFQRRTDN